MGHYRNVDAILALSEKYDFETLMELFETSDQRILVEDVAFIVCKLLNGYSIAERRKMINKLKTEISDWEFREELRDDLTSNVP